MNVCIYVDEPKIIVQFFSHKSGHALELNEIKAFEEKKLPIIPTELRDYIDSFNKNSIHELRSQTTDFIHSGLQSYVLRADRPTKYITRIQKSRNYHIASDISQFGATVLPTIYIAWVIKHIVRNTYNIIQKSNTHNNNSNVQGSE